MASHPEPVGSEPGFRRPVLVVQADSFNRSRIRTVLVVALAQAPGNVPVPAGLSGLPQDSVANVSQVLTCDRDFLTVRIGPLAGGLRGKVDQGLRLVLSL